MRQNLSYAVACLSHVLSTTVKIEPPADDLGLQRLKAADEKRTTVAPTDQVERTARIAPSEERREPLPVAPERRREERRRARDDRRQQHTNTPLDTREPHERRTTVRRESDREELREEGETPATGIDVQA